MPVQKILSAGPCVIALPLLILFLTGSPVLGEDRDPGKPPVLLADFESGFPGGVEMEACTPAVGTSRAPEGSNFLRVECPQEAVAARVRFPVPAEARPGRCRALCAWIRTSSREGERRFRWRAEDGKGRTLFQRRFSFDGGPVWHRIEWPLSLWRWGSSCTGRWSEVSRFCLVLESTGRVEVGLDDVRLLPARSFSGGARPDPSWILEIAFGDNPRRVRREDGFLVATDAVEGVSEADLGKVLEVIRPIPRWIERVFGEAMRPMASSDPFVLLIFEDRPSYRAFCGRLGTAWRASISPPRAGGYTIQDIATSYYDEKKGIERPVYFHETVHAAAARTLRLIPGTRAHSWLQEGLANYLQLCLYPGSLDREDIVRHFSTPIDPKGKTFFKPLSQLLTQRIGGSHYLQLATLTAFWIAEKPGWIGAIAQGIAEGREVEAVLEDLGTDFDALQREWYAWGASVFAPDATPPAGPGTHFAVPEEWARTEPQEQDG